MTMIIRKDHFGQDQGVKGGKINMHDVTSVTIL